MKWIFAMIVATSCFFQPGFSFADDIATQLTGTWKLVSWLTKFDGGDTVEPYGSNPKGRLVLTPDSHWIIILTGANRKPAKTIEEKAALLESMLAYSGKFIVDGDKITTHVEMSSNEIYTGTNQDQTRFFRIEGNRLIIRTPEIVSAVRPGQKAVGTLMFERER
ncbi:MAG TPA: lipocalin-like domain-containing protein [Xanthobacteraceae bacterium]